MTIDPATLASLTYSTIRGTSRPRLTLSDPKSHLGSRLLDAETEAGGSEFGLLRAGQELNVERGDHHGT